MNIRRRRIQASSYCWYWSCRCHLRVLCRLILYQYQNWGTLLTHQNIGDRVTVLAAVLGRAGESMNRKNISYHKEGGWLGYTATYTIHFASILPILAYKHNIQLIPKYLHICSVWTSYISSSPNLKWYYVNMSLQLPPANITTMWYGGTGTYLWRYCRCHHNKIFYF